MRGDAEDLALLEAIADESGKAKQLLRDLGFGVTGTNLMRTVQEAAEEIERLREIAFMYESVSK